MDVLIFGDKVPKYKWEVSRDTSTVEMLPISEFREGNTNKIIGKLANICSLLDNTVPEKSPITELIKTTIIDSLKIFLK